jgi:hypothetical protein
VPPLPPEPELVLEPDEVDGEVVPVDAPDEEVDDEEDDDESPEELADTVDDEPERLSVR